MKPEIIKEIQALQKTGACNNLNIIQNITEGKHDETIKDCADMGVTGLADLVIQLDELL